MPNILNQYVANDGVRSAIIRLHIVGDGSGDYTNQLIAAKGNFQGDFDEFKIKCINSNISGFEASLLWQGSPNVHAATIPDGDSTLKLYNAPIRNNAPSKTDSLLLSTNNLNNGSEGIIIIHLQKVKLPNVNARP